MLLMMNEVLCGWMWYGTKYSGGFEKNCVRIIGVLT
jgi:hypothetical protein